MRFNELESGELELVISDKNRALLETVKEESPDDFASDRTMYDFFEGPMANSEYEWIRPEETGDLTDAPMLGIRNTDEQITHRWAFMDYALISPLDELLDKGRVVFVGGSITG